MEIKNLFFCRDMLFYVVFPLVQIPDHAMITEYTVEIIQKLLEFRKIFYTQKGGAAQKAGSL